MGSKGGGPSVRSVSRWDREKLSVAPLHGSFLGLVVGDPMVWVIQQMEAGRRQSTTR